MEPRSRNPAPGHPGIPARWTSSAKSGVGTAPAVVSRVWFTLSHGILNEIYYPRVDYACTRDFGLIVTDGRGYFSEEKRDAASMIRPVDDGVPAFMLRNVSRDDRYVIEKLVLADPRRDVVLQHVRFKAQSRAVGDYRLYALLAPHLVNRGAHNTAWLADHKGREMLFASGSGNALALGCSAPWRARSVGFVGASDGWQDLTRHYVTPIVFFVAEDPVRLGLVASLARPGGSLTGINVLSIELAAKRWELLRELVPGAARIAVLVNPANATNTESILRGVEPAARSMGLQIQVLNASTIREIDAAFATLVRERPDALFVGPDPFLIDRRVQLALLAVLHRVPAIYQDRLNAEAGGLMSYGTNLTDAWRQLGVYTGRILKGAKPADLT
jgi:hypothetical protein